MSAALNASGKGRNVVFTINNNVESDVDNIKKLPIRGAVFYQEEAPTTGTPHGQGYMEFKTPMSFKAISAVLGGRAHLEVRRGTPKQAWDYCKKGEQPHAEWTELGTAGPNYGKNAVKLLEIGKYARVVEPQYLGHPVHYAIISPSSPNYPHTTVFEHDHGPPPIVRQHAFSHTAALEDAPLYRCEALGCSETFGW